MRDTCKHKTAVSLLHSILYNRPFRHHLVDFCHERHCLVHGNRSLLIMRQVFIRQQPPAPVFEPFVQSLIAADVERPQVGGEAFKILRFVDVDAPWLAACGRRVFGVASGDGVIASDGEAGDELGYGWRFQQVQADQFLPRAHRVRNRAASAG